MLQLDLIESNQDDLTEQLKVLYDTKDKLEVEFSAHMIYINDLRRVKLLNEGTGDEAEEKKAEEKYDHNKKQKRDINVKNNCDSELCTIYQCDEESEWDEEFICHNKCRIHLRCEGRIFEDKCLPENYECKQCKTGVSNKYWLEEKINERKTFFENKVQKLKKEHNDIASYTGHFICFIRLNKLVSQFMQF